MSGRVFALKKRNKNRIRKQFCFLFSYDEIRNDARWFLLCANNR